VLVDLALRVSRGEPVPIEMGYVNVIWQGDANRLAIECLARAASPAFVVNVTGAETLSVRDLAQRFGKRFGKSATFTGTERPDALLSNTTRMRGTFSAPQTTLDEMIDRVADWVDRGGTLLGKPTRFEARDGRF